MNDTAKKISSSMEDYLEAIASLERVKGAARVNDIGKLLRVKNPSVSAALAALAKSGLVVHERYGVVELTAMGKQVAARVQGRHDTLFKFLSEILNVEERTAQSDACKMEHAISEITMERLVKFIKEVERCPGFSKRQGVRGRAPGRKR